MRLRLPADATERIDVDLLVARPTGLDERLHVVVAPVPMPLVAADPFLPRPLGRTVRLTGAADLAPLDDGGCESELAFAGLVVRAVVVEPGVDGLVVTPLLGRHRPLLRRPDRFPLVCAQNVYTAFL